MPEIMICTKCGGARFNSWNRCMDCRNERAKVRSERIKTNGGLHTNAQWQSLLALSPTCAACGRLWADIPARPDPRYKHTWTKGHKVPVYHGGSDDIENIQAECYECNFKKNAGALGAKSIATAKLAPAPAPAPAHKIESTMATSPDRMSRIFCFVLNDGTKVFPVQMERRDTGNIAFRISPGGAGGNTLEASLEVDEQTMVHKVIKEGYAVRCKSVNGKTNGLYKHGHRSVSEVIFGPE